MKKLLIATTLLCVASPVFAGTASVPSFQQPVAAAADSGCYFRYAVYGWAEALDGDMTVRGLDVPVSMDFSDILDDLDVGLMGAFEVGRGDWSLLTDINYTKLGTDVGAPGGVIDLEFEQLLIQMVLSRRVVSNGVVDLDVMAGARGNWFDLDVAQGGLGRSVDLDWVDPTVGVRFRTRLSPEFYLRGLADIGGFGVESDLTWQVMLGVGWQFSESGGLLLGYRALGTDYSEGAFNYDVTAHGPVFGVEFRF